MISTLTRLRTLGYTLSLDGDSIKCQWQGEGQPDAREARPLLEALKTRKAEVLEILRAEAVLSLPPSAFPAWASCEAARLVEIPNPAERAAGLEAFEKVCATFDSLPGQAKQEALQSNATAPVIADYAPEIPPELLGYTPAPAEWSATDNELVTWFVNALETGALPAEPFSLWPHERVTDPPAFFAALQADIERGPGGARARTGAPQKRLQRLRELVGARAGTQEGLSIR